MPRLSLPALALSFTALFPHPLHAQDANAIRTIVQQSPQVTPEQKIKHAVLLDACDRADALKTAGRPEDSELLLKDIQAALAADPVKMATPADAQNLSVLFPVKTVNQNPYLDLLMEWAQKEMSREDKDFSSASGQSVFRGVTKTTDEGHDPRQVAAQMEAYLWLFANPASPLKGDPEVLARFLRRAHAYMAAIIAQQNLKAGDQIYDLFALAPASGALREYARLYPGLLLPEDQKTWDSAMKIGGAKALADARAHRAHHAKGYANIDISYACELLNFGLYLGNDDMLALSRELVANQKKEVLPDGGLHYIWSQNESAGYHDVCAQFLARIYEIDGNPDALAVLKAMEWYGPVSVARAGEYWTAPSWKFTYNSSLKGIVGGEFVATATENPYVKGMMIGPGTLSRAEFARASIPWYRADIPTKPLPDNVTYPDRNIAGPRAWYGRFSYAATLRDIPLDEPGHGTLMGARLMEPDFSMQSFLMGVYPKVRIGKDPAKPASWAWRTHDMKSALVVGRDFSAFSASYELETWTSSSKGVIAPARGQQVWLGLPDRVVGWVQVQPEKPDSGIQEILGVIRLGTGGTVNGKPQQIRSLGKDEFQYGDFIVRVIQHNFGKVEPVVVPFRLPKFPATEITLFDAVDRQTNPDSVEPQSFLVEIRPSWSAGPAEIALRGEASFEVKTGDRSFLVLANPFPKESQRDLPAPAAGMTLFRPTPEAPATTWSQPLTLGANQIAVLVSSPNPDDHLPGWESFQQMVGAQ